ncbi:dehydrogenase [Labrys miyagiensis]|uniref:Dehydrogenase n=1 Tax=Labrys miyagiensis TaxID=346912 RepID=A0ABQ6CN55_9HYPH|nr:YciI family protein [Labrys miyagiensis]GLS21560.1 dehydrogenase [Labrys miyagiensis]
MQYVCLVYAEDDAFKALGPAGQKTLDADSLAYDRELERLGHLVLAHALHSERESKVVRRRQKKTLVIDGPFTETKEQLVGFIVVEANGMDEAVAIAGDIPMAGIGTIVVRETLEFA